MKQLILQHPWQCLLIWYVASAFIGGMPEPDKTSGKGYRWLYSSLHIFAANLGKVKQQWSNGGNPFGPVISSDAQALKKSASKYSV